ncbi:uncharacterized protein BDV14DRAFT_188264 [Aspergillus stella-maris]|uniref:uncharacterized protein n=1 Tax=Aspergillus stella-maris TaxID=1810926 RepID=UPI003CCE1A0F
MSQPIALIFGAGVRVGASVASTFAAKGYAIATVSRTGTNAKTSEGYLSLKADFADPTSVSGLFDAVRETFGAAPPVVVYNASAMTVPPEEDSLLSVSAENFVADLNVNTVTPYIVAQRAVREWASLPDGDGSVKKTFIFTGNILNTTVWPTPVFLDLGVGKSASAFWIGSADQNYKGSGYRFFYADERDEEGKPKVQGLDGPAHAEFFASLVERESEVPWHATFVKEKGYVKF